MNLLAAFEWTSPSTWGAVLLAILGVGAVIFIHELGHFAVAKWCGVKCEKFYIGFGKPLVKYQYGETEYGIGMIPLGGFVKMLGQDDNPAQASAEMERARVEGNGGAEATVYDPRSYMAKSVPQRMAIISAGVIMNLIFAFAIATAAYGLGVQDEPCKIGYVAPGSAAWQVNLQPGDTITEIQGTPMYRFRDLRSVIALDNHDGGVEIRYVRPGIAGEQSVVVEPNTQGDLPRIGVGPMQLNRLAEKDPVRADTPAAEALVKFQPGDEIVRIDDEPVNDFVEMQRILSARPGQPLRVTVRRAMKDYPEKHEEFTIDVKPAPWKTLGIRMTMGEIVAVQKDSPAVHAEVRGATPNADATSKDGGSGLRAGDLIVAVNGDQSFDPMRLPEMLRQLAGTPVTLNVQRDSNQLEVVVTPRGGTLYEPPGGELQRGLSAPALGIVFEVVNHIQSIEPDSPADKAGLKKDMHIEWLAFLPREKSDGEERPRPVDPADGEKLKLGDEAGTVDWPVLVYLLQRRYASEKVLLKPEGGKEVELDFVSAADQYYPERGFNFAPERITITADSFGEAAQLGAQETLEMSTQVYKFIRQLFMRKVSVNNTGGPLTIAVVAFSFASEGFSAFLIFLAGLSANLAVINFLPIPVLDGGHFVFLALEGIRGKPVSEKVFIGFTYAGLAFLLLVMGFVLYLDISRFA